MVERIKCFVILALIILNTGIVNAQLKIVNYTKSIEDFPNPERGFYMALGGKPGELSDDELRKLRTVYSPKSPRANYSTRISLIYRGYLLTDFRNKEIGDEYLSKMQKDFDAIRAAGLKVILRFSYIDKTIKGECPDKAICPPYGDASKVIVLQHIAQLKPLLQKNADVIAVMQQGFIGIWGENHYTDYFGDASGNALGYVPDSSWVDRNEVLKALLDALPADRMVQVRTPQIKQRFLYGPLAPVTTNPVSHNKGYTRSDAARVGFHNDCFLASFDDYGTFSDYGNSAGKSKASVNEILRKYFEAESRYVAVGGETCDDAFSPQNDCAPLGYAEKEMAAMHYSFLNVSYNNLVNNDWETQGCMPAIKKRLGYRFVLKQAALPERLNVSQALKISLSLENEGFAAPYNPRELRLVLRNTETKETHFIALKSNIQNWVPGKIEINETVALPAGLKKGTYELLLSLPDDYDVLKERPEYSIRLANENVWEIQTGFNKLNHNLQIK